MAVLQMQKLCICALKKDRKSLMEFLQAAGVLELTAEAEPDEIFKRTDTLEDRQKFERNAATADRALEVLAAVVPEETSMLAGLAGKPLAKAGAYRETEANAEALLGQAERILNLQKQITEEKTAALRLLAEAESLKPWQKLEIPLAYQETKRCAILVGAVGGGAYTQEEIQKFRDGSDPDHYANARYLDEVFSRKGLQTGHDVTINGGNAENKYMVSFGYLKQNGIVEKNDYQRYNARVNLINEILPGLKLTSRLSGVYGNRKEPMAPGGDDADNMLVLIQKALRFPGLTPTILSDGSFGAGRELHGTPAGWIKSDSFYENPEFSLNANVRLDYNPIKDLQLSAIGAYTYTNGEERTYRSTMKLSGDRVLGPSELKHKMGKTIYKTFQATAEYNKTIGGHTFGILAGYSWEQEDYRYVQGSRVKFPGNGLPYMNAGSQDTQKSE